MPVEKVALPEQDAESGKIAGVRGMVRLLVKTQKAQRLYDSKNAVSERLELDLFERLCALVSEQGEVQLAVLESQLRCEDEVVFESPDRTDSLAFLLYRDGIRRLSFSPGLELQELRAFLRCLNRVALLTNDQEDLVTLLWEQDFHSIRYFAIEELTRSESYLPDEAIAVLHQGASTRDDPLLVKAFINCMGIFPIGSAVILRTGELAVVVNSNPDPDHLHQPQIRIVTDPGRRRVPPFLADLSQLGEEARGILRCVDPEKFGIVSAHYVF